MSTMLVEPYDALKEAGASEEKAQAAAASFGRPEQLLGQIERNLAGLSGETSGVRSEVGGLRGEVTALREDVTRLDKELAVVKAQIELLKWMNGIVIAGVLALIIRTFFA